jgi:probable F420-dependent oxidoreductase
MMKIRIGYGLGVRTKLHDATFGTVVDELERLRFDSLWLSERIGGEAPDPLVAMSFAAGRTETLKFGMSVMVLPGRNPIVLAKELATLAVMSGGRLLPAFGLGVADPHEQQAFGVERSARAKLFDESLAVMRACWTGEPVVHHGERFHYDGVRVLPAPGRLDVWLGGYAPSELRRVGRLADGWLPSFITPADAADGRSTIEQVCAENDRSIDDDHYGVLIPYSFEPIPDQVVARFRERRPDLDDPSVLVPASWERLVSLIREFVDVGCTKFVVIPLAEPTDADAWAAHLGEAAEVLLPLER